MLGVHCARRTNPTYFLGMGVLFTPILLRLCMLEGIVMEVTLVQRICTFGRTGVRGVRWGCICLKPQHPLHSVADKQRVSMVTKQDGRGVHCSVRIDPETACADLR